jgi:hypothetical protein
MKPLDLSPEFTLPGIPTVTDSPNSSAPSTPSEETQGHRRTGSIALGNEDYFMSALRLRQDSKSVPGTPSGSTKRSATFSPRIIFYDTWPSQEYDRRGDIATCNRLTPMLAQQIKEELNSFKMVSCIVYKCCPTTDANLWCLGDGSTRTLQDLHSLLLMTIMGGGGGPAPPFQKKKRLFSRLIE